MTATALAIGAAVLVACGIAAYLLSTRGRNRAAWIVCAIAPLAAALPLVGWVKLAVRPAATTAPSEPAATPPTTPPRTASPPAAAAATPAAAAAAGAPAQAAVPPATARPVPESERAAADNLRKAKRYAEARDAYAALAARHPGDPDLWADLADSTAAANGGDLETASEAIEQALRLAPDHVKALWLKASLELQRHHYAGAGQIWQKLLGLLPPDSEDHRIVAANLSEAQALAAKGQAAK